MNFPTYPETRDAGVDWLGNVPKHWNTSRLKWTSPTSKNGVWGDEPDGMNEIVCVRVADFDRIGRRVNLTNPTYRAIPTNQRKGRLLKRSDLLIEKSGGGEQQPVGTVVLYDHDEEAVSSNFVAKLEVERGYSPNFLTFLHAMLYESGLTRRSIKQTTGIQNLDAESYFNEVVPLPPYAEQLAIANFLDAKTSTIDNLIRKKERLIEVLQEKRQAVITRAVTKGLNSQVSMKNSGFAWLGEIPTNWSVNKLLRLAFFQEGPGLRNWQFTDYGIRVICVTNITVDGINFNSYKKFISQDEYSSSYRHFTVRNGDLLLSSSGNSWGKIAEYSSDETVILNTSTIRINENKTRSLSRLYLKWLLQSECVREQLQLMMTGSCQPNFGPSHLARVIVAVPPLNEQEAICEHLAERITSMDSLSKKIRSQVEVLTEFRQTLITAAVTGKIDVRQYVEKRIPAAQEEVMA